MEHIYNGNAANALAQEIIDRFIELEHSIFTRIWVDFRETLREKAAWLLKRHCQFRRVCPRGGVHQQEKRIELFERDTLDKLEPGKLVSLQAIHKALFGNTYDFAGQLHTMNLAKGNFRFAPLIYL